MKKVLALVLAATMALGMATTAFAATKGTVKIKDQVTNLGYCSYGGAGLVDVGEIRPYDKIKRDILLTTAMFTWKDDNGALDPKDYPTNDLLTSTQIRNGKMNVRSSVRAGSKAIKEIKFVNKDSKIEVAFAETLVSTKDLDFDFTVYLTVDGKRRDDDGLQITGTLANETRDVYADDDYFDLAYGTIAAAQDFVPKIEMDLGNGVSIHTKLFKGKKYYGTCTRDSDAADDIVFAKYPDVDNVVTLNTIGLNSTGDIVQLDTDYSDYYVYDKDMKYLGKSNQMLPYSTKYYLANKELNVADDDETVEGAPEAEDGDGENPESGGDDGIENSNANPSTGC